MPKTIASTGIKYPIAPNGVTYIYSLSNPDGRIQYIGKTNNPNRRLSDHLYTKKITRRTSWLINLRKNNLLPILEIIDEVPENEWQFWEMHYISLYKSWGFDLKNGDNGGLGHGRLSEETRKKIGEKLRAMGVYERLSQRLKQPRSESHILNSRLCQLGRKHSDETRRKMSLAAKGKNNWSKGSKRGKYSENHCRKISEALKKSEKIKAAVNKRRQEREGLLK